jgi:HSP20 family molecular chaperone IbpA
LPPIPLDERRLNQEQKAKGFLSTSSSFLLPPITPRTYYDHSSFIKEQQNFRHPYQYEQKQIYNHLPVEKNSFASSTSLVANNNNNTQLNLLTSTPIRPSTSSHYSTTDNNNIIDRSSIFEVPTGLQYKCTTCQLNDMSLGTGSKTHSYDQRISDQGNKYIIQLKTDDYQENEFTITINSDQNQLIIDAKHNEEDSLGGFIRRELHKIFLIPKHIDLNKHTNSYNKNTQELTIEMPYLLSNINETKSDSSFISPIKNTNESLTFSYGNLNLANVGNILSTTPPIINNTSNNISGFDTTLNNLTITNNTTVAAATTEPSVANTKPFDFDLFHRSAFRPQILQTQNNENKLSMSLDLSNYQPEDIKISIKDQELIVKAERKIETDTKKSRSSFFQSTSLPPETDIDHLKSNYIDGKLIIEAPYLDQRKKTNE